MRKNTGEIAPTCRRMKLRKNYFKCLGDKYAAIGHGRFAAVKTEKSPFFDRVAKIGETVAAVSPPLLATPYDARFTTDQLAEVNVKSDCKVFQYQMQSFH